MIPLIPFGLLEQLLKLIILFIESTPPAIRTAQALIWFWLWWPMMQLFLKDDVKKQIEDIVKGIATPAEVPKLKAVIAEHKNLPVDLPDLRTA